MDCLRRLQAFLFFSIIISMVIFFAGEWALWQWVWQSLIIVLFISLLPEIFFKQSLQQWQLLIFPWIALIGFVLYSFGQAFLGYAFVLEGVGYGSVYPWATYQASFHMLFFILFGISCCVLFRSRRFLDVFLFVLPIIVFVIAIFCFMQTLSVKTPILWRTLINDKRLFGPFFNQNHFGGFVILVLPMLLGYLHYQWLLWKDKIKESLLESNFWQQSIEFMKSSFCFLLIVVVITFVMVFFSLGRWPFLVLAFVCSLYLLIMAFSKYRWLSVALAGIILSVCFIYYHLMPSDFWNNHFMKGLKETTNSRISAITQTMDFAKNRPLWGTGLGTFYYISTKFIAQDQAILNHAHNDFIETWLESGLVGLIFVLMFIGLCFYQGWRHFHQHQSRLLKILTLQALVTLILFIILEMGDYYIRNPLNALFLIIQISILFIPPQQQEEASQGSCSFLSYAKGLGVAFSFMTILLMSVFVYQNYDVAVVMDKKDKMTVFEWKKVVKKFPDNAQIWFLLAQAQLKTMQSIKGPGAVFLRHPVVDSLQQAVQLSPTFAHYWYALALVESSLKRHQQAEWAISKACFWAPYSTKYLSLYKTLHLKNY